MADEKKSSRPRAMGQFSADVEHGAAPTIVGGQPHAARRHAVSVPVGLEKVLYAAAANPTFREALLRDREAAVKSAGLQLKPSELAMLRIAPESQLVSAIASLDVSESNVKRHSFMGKVAAAAVTIAAGGALGACDPMIDSDGPAGDSAGIRPDGAIADVSHVDVAGAEAAPAGIRPDAGYVDAAGVEYATQGIRPDASYVDVESTEPGSYGIQPDADFVDVESAELTSNGIRPE